MTCDAFLSGWPNRLRPVSAVQYGPVRSEGYGKGNMGSRYFLTCCKYLLCVISVAAAQLLSLFLRGGQKLRGARLGSGSGLSDEFFGVVIRGQRPESASLASIGEGSARRTEMEIARNLAERLMQEVVPWSSAT